MNQCLGRAIRHKNDYGAVFLVDGRFRNDDYKNGICDWIKKDIQIIRNNTNLKKCNDELKIFYDVFRNK